MMLNNIIKINYENENKIYLISRYYENGSINNIHFLENLTDLSLSECLYNISLNYINYNEYNITHGNLNPSHIMINEDNYAFISCCEYLVNIKNNIYYSSPEVILKNEITEYSDIWSLGCIFYFIIKHKNLFNTIEFNNDYLELINECGIYKKILKRMLNHIPYLRINCNEILCLIKEYNNIINENKEIIIKNREYSLIKTLLIDNHYKYTSLFINDFFSNINERRLCRILKEWCIYCSENGCYYLINSIFTFPELYKRISYFIFEDNLSRELIEENIFSLILSTNQDINDIYPCHISYPCIILYLS